MKSNYIPPGKFPLSGNSLFTIANPIRQPGHRKRLPRARMRSLVNSFRGGHGRATDMHKLRRTDRLFGVFYDAAHQQRVPAVE